MRANENFITSKYKKGFETMTIPSEDMNNGLSPAKIEMKNKEIFFLFLFSLNFFSGEEFSIIVSSHFSKFHNHFLFFFFETCLLNLCANETTDRYAHLK